MTAPPRSWLYVPGSRPDRVAKALTSHADAVVIDLEDSVPATDKTGARRHAANLLATPPPLPVHVRINHPRSSLARADVDALAGAHLDGVRVPKVEAPSTVVDITSWLRAAGMDVAVYCLLESAIAVERAFDIARADPLVAGVSLGEADLAADLDVAASSGLDFARSRCVLASRAAGLGPPIQSVYTGVRDLAGLRADCAHGRRLGFFGRSAVHPRQLPVINEVFTPTDSEVAHARELLEKLARTSDGALVLPDGRFVDVAVAERARRLVELAEALHRRTSTRASHGPPTTHKGSST